MRASLHDAALIEHEDRIGMTHCRKAVGDQDHCLARRQMLKGFLDLTFVLGVSEGGSLVPISTTGANPHKYGTFQKI